MLKLIITISFLFLVNCSSNKEKELNADKILYEDAIKALEKNRFIKASDYLNELESNHPFSSYIVKTEILLAFINYVNKNYDESYNFAEKFIKLRPANEYVAYMYYLRSLSIYNQSSDYLREQSQTRKAQRSFRELIVRFPDSPYSKSATIELNFITNKLSAHEMALVRFYESQKLYISALDIVKKTISNYPNSPYNAEARFREIEILTILKLYKIRDDRLVEMLTKHPGSQWSIEAKKISSINT